MKELNRILITMSLIIFITTYPTILAAYTPERGNVTATLSPYIFHTVFPDAPNFLDSPDMGGISLTALGDVNDRGSLEISMIYMNKVYFREQDQRYVAEKTQLMHITLGYRHWVTSYFSASLGLFTSYPMGEVYTTHTDFLPSEEFKTTATEPSETGLDLALQGEFWSSGRYAIVGDARYSYSLTKQSGEYSDQFGVSVGLRYFIQGPSETKSQTEKSKMSRP